MRPVNIFQIADDARLTRFHASIFVMCCCLIISDGYDLAIAGIALPSIMSQLYVTPTQAGFMLSSALFGMMFGAIVFGIISDRVGRRLTMVICLFLISLFSVAAGFAHDALIFSGARFIAGIGIGGLMPITVAQMAEYSPRNIRSTLVTLMFSGYSVGGVFAGLICKFLLVHFGWRTVFFAAGFPVFLIPVILKMMPEAFSHLIRSRRDVELQNLAQKLNSRFVAQSDDVFAPPNDSTCERFTARELFRDGRKVGTLMIWLTFFMNLFIVYALSSWLVKLMIISGHDLSTAVNFAMFLHVGAIVGNISGGFLADRLNARVVLVGMYLIMAASVACLGLTLPVWALSFVVAIAGGATMGAQTLMYAFVGQFYPPSISATGLGCASGIGRGGAILAPIVIGALVGHAFPMSANFLAIALPALIAAVAISLSGGRKREASICAQRTA
ncbi:MFS transporter [Trinickia sp. EG282A]|uniref:MFS transporter n=1 Tax=Trinickia sp. EG282A TaxID=3237013 RepID=UPI0034D35F68